MIPVGRWFKVTTQIRQSKDFDGSLKIWQDDVLLYDLQDIRTELGELQLQLLVHEHRMVREQLRGRARPAPAVIYVDDGRIDAGFRNALVRRPAQHAVDADVVSRSSAGICRNRENVSIRRLSPRLYAIDLISKPAASNAFRYAAEEAVQADVFERRDRMALETRRRGVYDPARKHTWAHGTFRPVRP